MPRPADNHEKKKREILAGAEKLFLEKGYEQTSIDDVLKESGISKGGLYHYFQSKEEMLSESIKNIIDEAVHFLQPIADDEKRGALEKFQLFMIKTAEFQSTKLEYAKLLGVLLHSDMMQYKYYSFLAQKLVAPFAHIIEQGVREGVFHVDFPYETADILIRAVVSVVQSASYDDYVHDETKHRQYLLSLRTVIARTLGISPKDFTVYDED